MMTKQSLIKMARKMNHDAIANTRKNLKATAELCREFRDINMRHARKMA